MIVSNPGRVPWLYQYWPGGFMLFVALCPGTPEGSTGSGSGFKASQKTGQRLKVSSDRLGEPGNQTCDPWFIPYTTAASSSLSAWNVVHLYPLSKSINVLSKLIVWYFQQTVCRLLLSNLLIIWCTQHLCTSSYLVPLSGNTYNIMIYLLWIRTNNIFKTNNQVAYKIKCKT